MKSVLKRNKILIIIVAVLLLILLIFLVLRVRFSKNQDDPHMKESLINLEKTETFVRDYRDGEMKLHPIRNFSCNVNVNQTSYKVFAYGDQYRIESTEKLIISNGTELYIKTELYEKRMQQITQDLFDEIGIPSTNDIFQKIKDEGTDYTVQSEENYYIIEIVDEKNKEIYHISKEYGLVMTGQIFEENDLLMSFTLTDVKALTADLPENIFEIPD